MKLAASLFSITGLTVCLLATLGAHAILYKSIDPNGQATYIDIPPKSGKTVEKTALQKNSNRDANKLPYEFAQVITNSPVTLYTSTTCLPCDNGRNLLNSHGIRFSEKNDHQQRRSSTPKNNQRRKPIIAITINRMQ
ncbi:MAG: DUF4124 domain-containing protein [Glaciimonas sp.]|nr:DUF4124 domain-containing protein [Glaciimonas sp.]